MQNLLNELKQALQDEQIYLIDGELSKNLIVEDALKLEPRLIRCLVKSPIIKKHFFVEMDGVLVFDKIKLQNFVSNKAFLPNSFTAFQNKIGLYGDERNSFIGKNQDVVLTWSYKDCILEGGQDKDDQKRDEVFYNKILSPDEISRLEEEKVLTNFEKFVAVKAGDSWEIKEEKVKEISENDNLLIKGNNLLALYSLRAKYAGKIKLIYIDPPYNTGSDSFKYNDKFNHSTWLTFMKNRLEVAKDLLSQDGVIFVNLDDQESHYCKVMMDEIFGKDNFVCNVIWQKKYAPQNDSSWLSDNHDHILIFAKNKEIWRPNLLPRTDEMDDRYNNLDNDSRGCWKPGDMLAKRETAKDIYEITTPSGRIASPPKGTSWRYSKEKFKELVEENRVWFGKDGNNIPSVKRFLSDVRQGLTPLTIWSYAEVGHNQDAIREMQKLGYSGVFSTPKPEKLLQRIIQISTRENDLVLDFFAGSGTTPAVAHKMGRRWIAIEQMNYIKDLPEARIKKVLAGEQGGVSKAVNWQGGGEFVYLELMEWNEKYIQKIRQSTSTEGLLSVYELMKKEAFFRYDFEEKNLDENMSGFKQLDFVEQQKLLCDLVDKNHLYVNLGEIDDITYKISDEDKKLNKLFYHRQ